LPLYKTVKDSRNHGLWQPTDKRLMNVEDDEAGKLALFRARFGRGFDFAAPPVEGKDGKEGEEEDGDDLSDLISGYAVEIPVSKKDIKFVKGAGKKKK
jgi:hypothetical protein